MNVLMFGWEFPPYKTGGLGTACYGLTKGLSQQGIDVTFVVPFDSEDVSPAFVKLVGVKMLGVKSLLSPYQTGKQYCSVKNKRSVYGCDLFAEVDRYAVEASKLMNSSFDVIHAHDWMTYRAGILAKKRFKKPFIAHIHATEYDRTAGHPDLLIVEREAEGLRCADFVVANSYRLKEEVMRFYNIPGRKIVVVHWAIDHDDPASNVVHVPGWKEKTVLFLGRITVQKGPDYFVELASKVLNYCNNVRFVMAGSGDMLPSVISKSIECGLSDKMVFTGLLAGGDVHKAFSMADLFVMPSVSEPFGLVALESIKNGTPCIISKQSGVSEVLHHCFKVDFWDVDKMANIIISALSNKEVLDEMRARSFEEVERMTLDIPAKKIINLYNKVVSG
ncbi:glycosyltransferase family 4 protein [Candidatus Woesearchaeota archaeon]|nr:glycosyltransferase family 4 protein [Candidatus Woesearchaeota archaeon]